MQVIVSDLIAQHPELGGMTWLQYFRGFRDLWHDVYYLEDSGEWPYTRDGTGGFGKQNPELNIRCLASAMRSIDFDERWTLDGSWSGIDSGQRAGVIEAAELLVNVSASLEHPSESESSLDANGSCAIKNKLVQNGWRPVNALTVAGDYVKHRDYIASSRTERTVAKNSYVRGHCGWFSERSACFLAAGRSVVAQDTGFSSWLLVRGGPLAFTTPDEAGAAIEAVEARYAPHSDAAMAIARGHFSAKAFLQDLIDITVARRRLR